jgi:hypothetical protein
MAIRFQPTQLPHGDGVNSLELPQTAEQTFLRGAVLTLVDGAVSELGESGAILGVASHDAFASPSGDQVVYLAEGRQRFLGSVVGAEDAILTDLSDIDVGDTHTVKAVDGEWFVDSTTTEGAQVVITQVFEQIGCVVFRFLDSVVQEF